MRHIIYVEYYVKLKEIKYTQRLTEATVLEKATLQRFKHILVFDLLKIDVISCIMCNEVNRKIGD